MARNEQRRMALLDAALSVLAESGVRGLTHRAVDERAAVPVGTCVNYFRSKDALFDGVGRRIMQRLTPSPEDLAASAAVAPSRERFKELMRELVNRVMAAPELHLVLFELRLESNRRPALAASLLATLRAAFALDLSFHERAGLPGGREEIVLLHVALDGLLLNLLTVPALLGIQERDAVVDTLVDRLLPT